MARECIAITIYGGTCVEGVAYFILTGHYFDTSHIANGPTVTLVFCIAV